MGKTHYTIVDDPDLSMTELRDMASWQHHQIGSQQQLLVAKQQRLKFLKQQELGYQRDQEENERLEKLQEKVEAQEEKLKILRAVQGRVDSTRLSNDSLSELESVKTLFAEKEKELAKCFAKVEEMTHQLKQLHAPPNGPHRKNDIERLKQELLNHNNRNEHQTSQLEIQGSLLNQRTKNLKEVDKRIEELKELLHRRRSHNYSSVPAGNRNNSNSRGISNGATSRRSFPASQRSVPPESNGQHDTRQGSRQHTSNYYQYTALDGQNGGHRSLSNGIPPPDTNGIGTWRKPVIMSRPGEQSRQQLATSPQTSPHQIRHPVPQPRRQPHDPRIREDNSGSDTSSLTENSSLDSVPSLTGMSRQRPPLPGNRPMRSSPVQNVRGSYPEERTRSPGPQGAANQNRNSTLSVRDAHTKHLQSRAAGDRSPMYSPGNPSWPQPDSDSQVEDRDANRNIPAATQRHPPSPPMQHPVPAQRSKSIKPMDSTDSLSSKKSAPDDGTQNRRSHPIYHQHSPATVGIYSNNGVTKPADDKDPQGYDSELSEHSQQDDGNMAPISAERPASPVRDPTLLLHHHYRDADRLHNMPRPLKKRISYTESKDESYTFMNTEYREKLFKQTGLAKGVLPLIEEPEKLSSGEETSDKKGKDSAPGDEYSNDAVLTHSQYKEALAMLAQSPILSQSTVRAGPHGILKREGKSRRKGVRVRFDPLALLLDASLEGEYDQVRRIIQEVPNPSDANDEGITALHNAICANHSKIVNFLIVFGVDVNSPDSDGWTPLHCAASCNNLKMVRALVERGGCVFSTTISDRETPAEKCEKEEDGYLGCFEYLNDIEQKMGMANNGIVYGVYNYEAEKEDELSFKDGDKMKVIRKGDDEEKEWWWASIPSKDETEGYIPRNLVAMYPRVKPLFN